MHIRSKAIGVALALALALAARPASSQSPPLSPFPPGLRGDPTKGERIYQLRGCPACHGASGKGGRLGPDLTQPGPRREFGWYRAYLADPRSSVPGSIKPPTIISDQEMEDLVAHLLRLKGLR